MRQYEHKCEKFCNLGICIFNSQTFYGTYLCNFLLFFRYDINNCLFQAAYEKILQECQCTPYFHWGTDGMNFCRGKSLKCMNKILSRIGQFNIVDGKPCLAACEDQKNSVSITTSR